MERYEINKSIKFKSLVPMLTLILDILNYEMLDLDFIFVDYCYNIIKQAITESLKGFKQLLEVVKENKNNKFVSVLKELDNYHVNTCEECLSEIFYSYVYCEHCTEKNPRCGQIILCLKCFFKHNETVHHTSRSYYGFYKYDESELLKFISRLETRIKFGDMIPDMSEIKAPQLSLTKSSEVNNK
jgi:hypothetical protein